MTRPALTPLEHHEIQIGTPIPFPIFDAHATLLYGQGHVIANEQAFDALLEIGLFCYPQWPSHSGIAQLPSNVSEHPASFEQIRLQPGAILYLRKAGNESQAFEAARLVSWVKNEDLQLCACNPHGDLLQLQADTPVEIKLLNGEHIIAFASQVKVGATAQRPDLRLQYPAKITCRTLRKGLRARVGLPVSASGKNDAIYHEGHLGNLSASGGLLEMNQLFTTIGNELLLMLPLPVNGTEHLLELCAKVRNLQTGEHYDVPVVQYGLEFIGTTVSEHQLLEQYVFHSLQEHDL